VKRLLSSNEEKDRYLPSSVRVYCFNSKHVNDFQATVTFVTGRIKLDVSQMNIRVVKLNDSTRHMPGLLFNGGMLQYSNKSSVCVNG
jgi:hypothetical protein